DLQCAALSFSDAEGMPQRLTFATFLIPDGSYAGWRIDLYRLLPQPAAKAPGVPGWG
ncbi:MAG: hypothetical protein GKC04_06835, partial [Methanomicrobiales archaeon]|nr:hypothetical protein [Methanomicrobiales archaeon]